MRLFPVLGIAWAVAVLGCGSSSPDQNPPANDAGADAAAYGACAVSALALPLTQSGKSGRLAATLVAAEPNPPAKHDNTWTVRVQDTSGAPLDDAQIASAETYMPVHDHAGVPAPTAEETEPATFSVEVPFMMRGPWEVRLDLSSQRAGSDRVVFDVCVAE
jgi:hypothetical protein